jgi:hypothetical protein
MQAIHILAQHIQETDYRRGVLEAEAMELNPLQYVVAQQELNRLVRVKHTLQDGWNNAMSELAICRSAHPAHHHFDGDHVLADDFPLENRNSL